MLKAELHLHSKGDPQDKHIKYSLYQAIDEAHKQKYDVLAVTWHNKICDIADAVKYAKSKDILLIPGIEKDIHGKHTLIYFPPKEVEKIKTFKELKAIKEKNPNMFIIAAHPFYFVPICHKHNIIRHLELFDAWEFSYLYTKEFNPNSKTLKLQEKYKKPIVGNSDVHRLSDLGRTYTLIDAKKNAKSIFSAIKKNKIKIVTKPLKWKEIFEIIVSA